MLAYWAPVSGGKIKELTPCSRVKSLSARRGLQHCLQPQWSHDRYRFTLQVHEPFGDKTIDASPLTLQSGYLFAHL